MDSARHACIVVFISLLAVVLMATTVFWRSNAFWGRVLAQETPLPESQTMEEPVAPIEQEAVEAPAGTQSESGGEAVIQTGDAVSELSADNEVNSNTVETTNETPLPEEHDLEESTPEVKLPENEKQNENATSSDEHASSSAENMPEESAENGKKDEKSGEHEKEEGGDVIVETVNDTVIENNATSSASSGNNSANGSLNASIKTGNAHSEANITNVVNTNVVDSNGWLVLFNAFAEIFGDLDVRGLGFEPEVSCPIECEAVSNLTSENLNNATVSNDVAVEASSGENQASSADGDATVHTGGATAAANIVNIVNTNIVGSKYLLLSVNNFQSWFGDLVLPSKQFFQKLVGPVASSPEESGVSPAAESVSDDPSATSTNSATSVENDNTAMLENNISANADTGNNEANGEANISTGNSHSAVNVVNQVNTNILESDSLFILIKVFGNWNGNVFGLPEGVSWQLTEEGILIQGGAHPSLQASTSTTSHGAANLEVANNNNANVTNNVSVHASTGANDADAPSGVAAIVTGDAKAGANVVNIVNTNIVGRNWVLALINIFGDWEGDVAFGRPDLWLGGVANIGEQPAAPGESVEYVWTIYNRGDADATDVAFLSSLENDYLQLSEYESIVGENGAPGLNLGTIKAGDSMTITQQGVLGGPLPFGSTIIAHTASVSSFEDDENLNDNTETVAFEVVNRSPASPGAPANFSPGSYKPKLTLASTNSASSSAIHAGEKITFFMTLINEGNSPAYGVSIIDRLLDPDGAIINEQEWYLGEVLAHEEILIDFTVEIGAPTNSGTYRDVAFAMGTDGQNNFIRTKDVESLFEVIASQPLELESPEPPVSSQAVVTELASRALRTFGNEASAEEVLGVVTVNEPQRNESPSRENDAQPAFFALLGKLFEVVKNVVVPNSLTSLLLGVIFIAFARKQHRKSKDRKAKVKLVAQKRSAKAEKEKN